MKNKIISAMLLGMSVTLAVPCGTVFASEESDQTSITEITETSDPAENETEVDKVTQMESYATDAEAKATDSPTGFVDRLTEVSITQDTFGNYTESLANYISGTEINKDSLYDAEMSAADQASVLMVMESEEAVNAARYHIALAFENVFGEEAFQAGRDIRRAIDTGKDDQYAECENISDLNMMYTGITDTPKAYLPETTSTETSDTTSNETQDTKEEDTAQTESLSDYVTNLSDITVTIGGNIQNPALILDTSKVKSVEVDTSSVNTNEAGTYPITYTIIGMDDTTESISKNCTVEEDGTVTKLRTEMCAKADEMGKDITVEDYLSKWEAAVSEAKEKINTLTKKDDMQSVVDGLQAKHDEILAEQQLYITKTGYIEDFDTYCKGFEFDTETEKNAVAAIREETVGKINSAATVQEAADALAEGKKKVDEVSGSIEAVKETAQATIDGYYADMPTDNTTISKNVYEVINSKLSGATESSTVESIVNTAQHVFTDIGKGLSGQMSGFDSAYADMKGLSGDPDTTATIGLIADNGTTTDITDAEYRILDICKALTMDTDEFCKYLTTRVGTTISAGTKTDAYAAFMENFDNNELSKVKKEATEEIQAALDGIDVSNNPSMADKKEKLRAKLLDQIESATTIDDVNAAKTSALEEIKSFKEDAASSATLESAKTAAKEEINGIVNAQTAAALRDSLFNLAKTYTASIENATTTDSVSDYLAEFKENAELIIQKYADDQVLATTVSETLTKIEQLQGSVKSDYVTSEMTAMINTAKKNVQSATSADECNTIYNNLKDDYHEAYLASMRSVYAEKTQGLLNNASLTDTYKTQATSLVSKQVENINKSTSEEAMQKCYQLAQKQINQLVEQQNSADTLDKAKSDAISKLKAAYPNPTDNQSKILESYYTKINNAKSAGDIDNLVAACEDALKTNSSTNGVDSAASLQEARTDALNYIKEMYDSILNKGSVSSTDKEAAKTIYENYKAAIEAATTVEDINTLKEKCATELEKYGANRPVTNADTKTTAGSNPNTEASSKGDSSVSSTGGVQTGDENTKTIGLTLASMTAALAAAGFSLRKFLKKAVNREKSM